jgi:NTE family protein
MTMAAKDKDDISQGDRKAYAKKPVHFKYVVSEGSIFVFDMSDFISEKDVDNTDSFTFLSCEKTSGIPVENLHQETDRIFSFNAPYIIHNDEVNTILHFKLTFKDKNDSSDKQITHDAKVVVKRVHRAMIFQGGVALGAYEAGVFQAIVEELVKNDQDKRRKGVEIEKRPLFDIVAGASIGAMNGAIVVSSITKKGKSLEDEKNWQDSAKEVIEFWRAQQQAPTIADSLDVNPLYHYWRDTIHKTSKVLKHSATEMIEFYSNMNPDLKKWYDDMVANWSFVDPSILKDYFMNGWYIPAGAEAARRYYSAKQFLRTTGPLNVTTGILPWSAFGKFFDFFEQSNYMPRPDNKHYASFSLKRTLEQFADFPIKTKEGEPRFLLVTVDVQTGDAVTFDSYSKEAKYHDDKNTTYNHNGIEIEHALATGTFPDFFDYPKFKVNNVEMGIKNEEEHIFWDGGFRSNTPLREVIQAHRDYWHKIRKHTKEEEQDEDKLENDVPDLEVYIADLWPSELKEKPISFDRDFVENRKWGIIFGDRTDYDEQVANFVTDYIDLAKQLKSLAERNGASTDELNHILGKHATSKNTIGQTRRYDELLGGRFRLTKVVRIDHKDDGNDVADKVFDYSRKTIEKLMEDGYRDALIRMGLQAMKDEFVKLENKFVKLDGKSEIDDKDKDKKKLEQLEQEFQQIQLSVKTENSHDTGTIVSQVEDFIDNVRSLSDKLNENNRPIKEERALVIDAAKQFQETVLLHD